MANENLAVDEWRREVRDRWKAEDLRHTEVMRDVRGNSERIATLEGKLANGIQSVVHEVKEDVRILARNQWRIVWYVIGAVGVLTGAATVVGQLIS